MKLLVTGDIHIGRASSALPDEAQRFAPAVGAWHALVDYAIEQAVDAVLLSGDVADESNAFWEAIGPLEQGVARLHAAGIPAVAVAGNHDVQVLPRLARQLEDKGLTLLGAGGRWERITLDHAGQPALHVDGWSFPQREVRTSPLENYDLPRSDHLPTLAMVHGDLDAPASTYAPLDRAAMRALPASAWLLGHIHAPRLITGDHQPWILYPGSPQALDPGETGTHGPWLVRVENNRLLPPEPLSLSPVCYENIEIDLAEAQSTDDAQSQVYAALTEKARELAADAPALRQIVLRARLVGATCVSDQLRPLAQQVESDLSFAAGHAAVRIDRVRVATLPAVDLHTTARSSAAPGAVARLLLALDEPEPDPATQRLIDRAAESMRQAESHRDYLRLPNLTPTGQAQAREHLRTQARALLTQLLSQDQP